MPRRTSYTNRSKSPESHAKTQVISKFLATWGRIVGKSEPHLFYAELYAGNGYHVETGEKGTALECIDTICRDKMLHGRVEILLNEGNKRSADELRDALTSYTKTSCLRGWSVSAGKADEDLYHRLLGLTAGRPTFWFLDPTGWDGLSWRWILELTSGKYSDLVFFLSYENINRFMQFAGVESSLRMALGDQTVSTIHAELGRLETPREREQLIVSALRAAYMAEGRYSECMRFGKPGREKVSHYLVFLTKNKPARRKFMSIVQSVSNWHAFGVPIAGFASGRSVGQLSFFDDRGFEKEVALLIGGQFSGRKIRVKETIEDFFSPRVSLTDQMFKDILKDMESKGQVTVDIPANRRRKGFDGRPTLGDDRVLTFPAKEELDGDSFNY